MMKNRLKKGGWATLLALAAGVFSSWSSRASAAPGLFTLRTVGLYPSGGNENVLEFLTPAGQSVGRANTAGVTTWFDDGASSFQIGLTGPPHVNPVGEVNSRPIAVTPDGLVAGNSDRFVGLGIGQSAWIYSGSQTTEIGLLGLVHTRSDGYRENTARYLSAAAGDVFGTARRFGSGGGRSTFVYDGAASTEIGLLGAQHTHSSGYRHNTPIAANAAGHALGYAERFSGSSERGQSAWIYRNGVTSEMGLLDAAHTRTDGYRWNWSRHLNAGGRAAGIADRFSGSTPLGNDAWIYDGAASAVIGLTGPAHTSSDGSRAASISGLNDAGHVIGTAERFSGSTNVGQSAWFYDGQTSTEIGLTDAAHTSNSGVRVSAPSLLNEAGEVAGSALRYSGSGENGRSAWFFDGTSTTLVGLTDAAHTGQGGLRYSEPTFLTDSGFLAGVSTKYATDGSVAASTPWVLDSNANQTHALEFEVSAGGFAKTDIHYLGDDGTVLGSYRRYDGFNTLGDFAFYWTPADGMFDLGQYVDGGLSAAGWTRLYAATHTNALNQIAGNGLRVPGEQGAAYVLTPIPEPAGLALLVPITAVMRRSRRRDPRPHLRLHL